MPNDYLAQLRARRNQVQPEAAQPLPTNPLARSKPVSETMRVVELPRVEYELPPGESWTARLARPGCSYTLRPLQEAALCAIADVQGGFLPIGVGHGKSFVACLAATVLDRHFSIILAPASTVEQLRETYLELAKHFRVQPAHIMSYATLSQPRGTSLLEELALPYEDRSVVLVCDEAHRIKRLESARTKRIIRFMQKHQDVAFVALSGTMTSKSLKDFSHLAALSVRDNSPVPRDRHQLASWAECIDVAGRPSGHDWRMVAPLAEWADINLRCVGQQRSQLIRRAFQSRLRSAPGVVASREGSIGCSLILDRQQDLPVPPEIREQLARVEIGLDPQGEPIPDDVTAWRHSRHLIAGFFYRWIWPNGEDHAWLEARRSWFRWVRHELQEHSDEGYDSPFLVAGRTNREAEAGARRGIHVSWLRWREEKVKPVPPVEAVWVSDYLVKHAIDWLESQRDPSILWYSSSALGDELERLGVRVYGAGEIPPQDAHPCAMSIKAHGIGKNLQSWSNQYILEPPSSGTAWEQLLGRTHRQGQEADEVSCRIALHAAPFAQALRTAREDARYVEDASGNQQKLNYATLI